MKTLHIINLSVALMAIGVFYGCCNRNPKKDVHAEEPSTETYFTAIDKYLTEEIGSKYLQGEVCIPFHPYVEVDESNGDDILVWGDFWVVNYTVSGDTLKTVSGGDHPGKMHVRQTPEGHFEVTSFEAVGEGSEMEPSARRIFGEHFDAFLKSNSDEKHRENIRMDAVAAYVRDHQLPVKLVKDYGWPEVMIPVAE